MRSVYTILFMSLLAACASGEKKEEKSKQVVIKAASDVHSSLYEDLSGLIIFEDMGNEIKVTANVTGLKPNSKLGFHVHEKGVCEGPAYKSAGGHFNPYHKPHDGISGQERHLGDLGNLETDTRGVAKKEIMIPKYSQGDLGLLAGKSVLIHEKRDDMKSQPSGDSGERIACGLIKPIE